MILRRLHVQRFRTLDDFETEFSPGLNVLRGPNEAGKSTLQAAIIALLFSDPGLRGRGDMSVDLMQSWGASAPPLITAEFATPAKEHTLVKDFEAKRAELTLPDGTKLTDRAKVKLHMREIVTLDDPDVYEATACLRQQQWARVSGGDELQESLQEALTGGAEGATTQKILRDLDKALEALERGTKTHAPKNPGPLAQTDRELQDAREELQQARADADEREAARTRFEAAAEAIAQLDADLHNDTALEKRVARYVKLDRERGSLAERADEIDKRLERVQRLEGEIQVLEEGLAEGPQVDHQLAEDVRGWSNSEAERADGLAKEREQERLLEDQRKRVESELEKASGGGPPPGLLDRARELKAAADEATTTAADHARIGADAAGAIAAGERRLAPRKYLLAAGSVALLLGIGLTLTSPAYLALAAAGATAVVIGLAIRPPEGWRDLPRRFEEAKAAREEQDRIAQARALDLTELLAQVDCEDVDGLAEIIAGRDRERVEAETRLEALRGNIAVLRERINQTEAVLKALREKLKSALDATALPSVERLVEMARAREKARRALGEKEQARAGALGDDTVEDLKQRARELAREIRGIDEELETPELANARLSPDEYQKLRTRIQDLDASREEKEEQQREARRVMDRARHDVDDVRALEGRVDGLVRRRRLLAERREVWALAREVIAQAQVQALSAATEAMAPRMGALLAQLTAGRYRDASLDSNLTPRVISPDAGAPDELAPTEDSEGLSCATREQVFLAARLALVDMLWPEGGPPLLLDDPLVNFDPERRQAALAAVKSAAEIHQIILFTCGDEYDRAADRIIEMPGPQPT